MLLRPEDSGHGVHKRHLHRSSQEGHSSKACTQKRSLAVAQDIDLTRTRRSQADNQRTRRIRRPRPSMERSGFNRTHTRLTVVDLRSAFVRVRSWGMAFVLCWCLATENDGTAPFVRLVMASPFSPSVVLYWRSRVADINFGISRCNSWTWNCSVGDGFVGNFRHS